MYSERLMELFHSRSRGGDLPGATHFGQAGQPGGGPWVQLFLRVEDGAVTAARWRTYGCPASMACSEAVCRNVEGRPAETLARITAETVTEWVGGVPEGKEHCPELAAQACRSVESTGAESAKRRTNDARIS